MTLSGERRRLPPDPIVHKRFEAHASGTPDKVALVCADSRVTYGELNARANRFARLLAERGIGRGQIVGVCLDYSVDLVVAVLGIIKSGAAYVPLDPSYPAERLRLLAGQVPGLALIVVSEDTAELVRPVAVDLVDPADRAGELDLLPGTDLDVPVTGDDLCYAVFTSGSTGTPKVTAARHEGWFNLLDWLTAEYGLDGGSDNLVVSAFGFDLTQRSLLTPLFCGATQHLMPAGAFDAAIVHRTLAEHGIRTLHCATSTLYLLVDWETARGGAALARLSHVFFGGEPLAVDRIAHWVRRADNTCTLLHQYGVAECTDVASSYVLSADRVGQPVVPVGRPVYNTGIHVLDELQEVEPGEYGEVCLSGVGVGAGYLNGSGPDTERFTTISRDGRPCRVYRTGDRGYVTPDGDLVVVGRMDDQVKVRGMRVDVADVERALRALPGVREAAVVPRTAGSGEVDLVAFVVPSSGEISEREVRAGLRAVLPRAMIPGDLVSLPEIPLNQHGKTDRGALAARVRETVPR